jgi:site-specific DNA recombinase
MDATGSLKDTLAAQLSAAQAELAHQQSALDEAREQSEALECRQVELAWVTRALSNFGSVWEAMSPPNQSRLLRALVEKIVVDQTSGAVHIHLAQLEAIEEVAA